MTTTTDTETQGIILDSIRLHLAKRAAQAVTLHMQSVLETFPAELAQLNIDDDLLMAVKVLRRVTPD
jgi:hypothetical protein